MSDMQRVAKRRISSPTLSSTKELAGLVWLNSFVDEATVIFEILRLVQRSRCALLYNARFLPFQRSQDRNEFVQNRVQQLFVSAKPNCCPNSEAVLSYFCYS
jgi:hypothetical protein